MCMTILELVDWHDHVKRFHSERIEEQRSISSSQQQPAYKKNYF